MSLVLPIRLIAPTPPAVAGGVNISTSSSITLVPVSSSPLMIGIRPSAMRTPDGYQRPCAISGCSRQVSVNGLKV